MPAGCLCLSLKDAVGWEHRFSILAAIHATTASVACEITAGVMAPVMLVKASEPVVAGIAATTSGLWLIPLRLQWTCKGS